MNRELEQLKKTYTEISMSEEQVKQMKENIEQAKKDKKAQMKPHYIKRVALTAAGVAIVFVASPNLSKNIANAMEKIPVIGEFVDVVTFRDYQYEDDRNEAKITVPELIVTDNSTNESADANSESSSGDTAQDMNSVTTTDSSTKETLEKTTQEINTEIQEITDQLVKEFEESKKEEAGYQSMEVKSEVIATTKDYFTLKLICYQAAGSGAEWAYYYTIDLTTGERLELSELFEKDADYQTIISENIKEQMREQMKSEDVAYWIDSDMPDWDFKSIKENNSFYINAQNNLVICFDEGEVAPMYMGSVEFEIPADVIAGIRIMK
ncbi:RsiV family protein [Anaerosporobacter faecicola]|uniref:RsiV family protein n=1 Tax=Anaerosporobacter faecicola TaxID=2718714 RepID=UPI0014392B24|nr:RsiV family protein [Anaerosporobacter faecicola]